MRRPLVLTGAGMLLVAVLLGIAVTWAGPDAPSAIDRWWNGLPIRPALLVGPARVLDAVGGGWIATYAVPILIAAVLVLLRRWRAALYAIVAFIVSAALVQLLKHLFGRDRPIDMLVTSDFGSFPSGHTANAATIAVVLWLVLRRRWVAVAGAAWVIAMALSRTVLSVHWASDTVGGALLGAASALLVAAVAPAALSPAASRLDSAVPLTEEPAMPVIRPYRPSDRPALFDICVRTADAGADATGLFSDDELWGLLFAVPYAQRHPDLCWIVESDDGRAVGYIVATDDTDAFEKWFQEEWWPRFAERFPRPEHPRTREQRMIAYGWDRGPGQQPLVAQYPAHLHIDLLPETQGQGLGRRLLETLFAELAARGVVGLHLGMDSSNVGAGAFYDRMGMQRLSEGDGSTVYGIRF